jgi:hypothetical protein
VAVTHPPSGIAGSTPARRIRLARLSIGRTSAPQAERAGSIPARVALEHYQVVELGYTRRSERRAARHGSSTLPLVTDRRRRCPIDMTQVSQCSAGPHKPGPPGATPGPAICKNDIHGRVRKQAKRRGREPRDFVGSTPTSVTHAIPWSSGQDAWSTSRKSVVQVHPGSLWSVSAIGRTPPR